MSFLAIHIDGHIPTYTAKTSDIETFNIYKTLDIPLRKLFGDEYAPSPAYHGLCSLFEALQLTCSHAFFLNKKPIFLFLRESVLLILTQRVREVIKG